MRTIRCLAVLWLLQLVGCSVGDRTDFAFFTTDGAVVIVTTEKGTFRAVRISGDTRQELFTTNVEMKDLLAVDRTNALFLFRSGRVLRLLGLGRDEKITLPTGTLPDKVQSGIVTQDKIYVSTFDDQTEVADILALDHTGARRIRRFLGAKTRIILFFELTSDQILAADGKSTFWLNTTSGESGTLIERLHCGTNGGAWLEREDGSLVRAIFGDGSWHPAEEYGTGLSELANGSPVLCSATTFAIVVDDSATQVFFAGLRMEVAIDPRDSLIDINLTDGPRLLAFRPESDREESDRKVSDRDAATDATLYVYEEQADKSWSTRRIGVVGRYFLHRRFLP